MNRTAAVYARVSSERQREEGTIDSQVACVSDFAREHGYTVPAEWVFRDEGYSGSVLARPGLERLRDLASEGQLESVLVLSPDRLSRRYAYQVLLLEEFSRHGVETVFVKSVKGDTPEEQLLLQFQGMIAEYERAQITERCRRGKRHRARNGCVNVLSGAPYGYRYVKKTDHSDAYYEVLDGEALIVREVFRRYTEELASIADIVRWLNREAVPTRRGAARWERSTVWAMLRNPAYMGLAAFGKTQSRERRKVTRPLRRRGGFSSRDSAHEERPCEQWIGIPVPPLVSTATFELARERLQENKRLSRRNTKQPSLLQGLLVCGNCGYALYRTSTRTSKRRIYYYRCLGSDNYRHPEGRVCNCRPIRQDYLDTLVWDAVLSALSDDSLVQGEIDRRMEQQQNHDPARQREETIAAELKRVRCAVDKLLDAYQEDLVSLPELRARMPALRNREGALVNELQGVRAQLMSSARVAAIEASVGDFRQYLAVHAHKLGVAERQKVLRLLIRDVTVGDTTITINHSIPVDDGETQLQTRCYELRKGRAVAAAVEYRAGRA